MEDLKVEIWKPIVYNGIDYTGHYEISNIGRVKSLKSLIFNKLFCGTEGYKHVTLSIENKLRTIHVHRLVATCFLGEIKHGFVVDHINSNILDNNASNLQIITKRANCSKEKTIKRGLPCGVHIRNGRVKKYIQCLIRIGLQIHSLGYYKTIESASKAYKIALNVYEQGFELSNIFQAIDEYRASTSLKKIKRNK